ncbi:hypothetical protein HPB49_007150 [Dermacentor silvarum]|uniref:Uncharacterized protein n=1 Tax=Dermacentor silvarum TaxID=543639 RepID=A0ACB8CJR8_DERSI|nr:hypothetical protein HPB49_007150 [Dermacentor silvarum]
MEPLLWKGQPCRLDFQGNVSAFTLYQCPLVGRANLASDVDRISSDYDCRDLPTTCARTMCARYCRATRVNRAPPSSLRLEQI